MDTIALSLQARDTDRKAAVLRRESIVPCVLYGNNVDNATLQCDHNELYRAYAKAGESTIVELDVGSKKIPVLFHSIDFHPVTDKIMHVDFYAVDMNKEIEAQVPIHFTGVAPAVKDLGGVLVTALDHVTVRCLPADLPHALEVSIESLATYDDQVVVGDIPVPDKVAVLAEEDQMVATTQEPRRVVEEEETAAEGEEGESAEGEGDSEASSEEASGDSEGDS